MDPLVTVVVPSFRGSTRLPALWGRLAPVLDTLGGELVLVDDASDDETWPVMLGMAEADPRVRCLRLARRSGQQVATLAGCSVARGRWVLTMDDDLEHDPVEIPRLLARGAEGCDLVYGLPRARPPRPLRRLGSRLFDLAFWLLIGKPRGLRLTSFRALRADLLAGMLRDRAGHVYVSALALRRRPRVGSVPVTPGPHAASRTSFGRLAATFARTLLAYGPLGTLRRGRPVRELLPIAETRGVQMRSKAQA